MSTDQPVTGTEPKRYKRDEPRRFRHFLLKIGLAYAAVSVALYFLFSALMVQHAYDDMAEEEVRHLSQMVFESMFTAMLAGQGRQGIEDAARRMSGTVPGMVVSIVRGEAVDRQFGENRLDALRRQNDRDIFEAFETGKERMTPKEGRVRYLYPARFRPLCQQCHQGIEPGQVAGVIEVIYPITNPKVSTGYVEKLMITYFLVSFFVLILFLSWRYRQD
jgi:hypothetical protein